MSDRGHERTVTDLFAGLGRAETAHECLLCGYSMQHDSSAWPGVDPLSSKFLKKVSFLTRYETPREFGECRLRALRDTQEIEVQVG